MRHKHVFRRYVLWEVRSLDKPWPKGAVKYLCSCGEVGYAIPAEAARAS